MSTKSQPRKPSSKQLAQALAARDLDLGDIVLFHESAKDRKMDAVGYIAGRTLAPPEYAEGWIEAAKEKGWIS